MLHAYRVKLRGGLPGADGDEVARQRVEAFVNKMRPTGLLVRLEYPRDRRNSRRSVRTTSRCILLTWGPLPLAYRTRVFAATCHLTLTL